MKIAFDVDNVLADTMACWCKKASRHLGRVVTKEDIKSHKIVGSIPMSPHEIFKLQDEVWNEWQSLLPTEKHLPQKLELLRANGFHVLIVTSRPLRSINLVKKWLNHQQIPFDQFNAFGPYEFKTQIEADALVDDAPNQIRAFIRPGRIGFLYTQPWNRTVKVREAVIVENVNDILKFYGLGRQLRLLKGKI